MHQVRDMCHIVIMGTALSARATVEAVGEVVVPNSHYLDTKDSTNLRAWQDLKPDRWVGRGQALLCHCTDAVSQAIVPPQQALCSRHCTVPLDPVELPNEHH